jgi:thiol-disulfide isomerase/thioredoxin
MLTHTALKHAALTGALLLGSALVAWAGTDGMSFEQAIEASGRDDQPVLVKVGTEWCSSCKAFSSAVADDAEFRAAIADEAILVEVDAEKGAGIELARTYGVKAYPTFLLVNAEGEVIDRWLGFKDSSGFTQTLAGATEDLLPISERFARLRTEPTARDAARLGQLRMAEGYHAEARALYQRAMQLDKTANHTIDVFKATANGMRDGLFNRADLVNAADAVYAASPGKPELFGVLWAMRETARRAGDDDLYVPYLQAAMETTESVEDEGVARYRSFYAADYALFVEKDAKRAIEVRRASMPEGWKEDSTQLNNFAWWCFENQLNLDEAYELARRGVDLADAGTMKANVLDTLAEICTLRGDCDEAVTLIHLAMAEDPENPYFQEQARRFEQAALAQQQR